jgi:hypothetical protein
MGCGSLWSLRGAGAASSRPSPHLRATRGGAPCSWEWEPPGGAGRCSPWPERTGVRAAASARSSPAAASAQSSSVVKASLPAVKRESSPAVRGAAPPRPGGGASGGGHGGQQARFRGCCRCMLHVLGMFLKNVASVSCECCKSGSRSAML